MVEFTKIAPYWFYSRSFPYCDLGSIIKMQLQLSNISEIPI